MVLGIIPECRSASFRNERSASPESPPPYATPAKPLTTNRKLAAPVPMARLRVFFKSRGLRGAARGGSRQRPSGPQVLVALMLRLSPRGRNYAILWFGRDEAVP